MGEGSGGAKVGEEEMALCREKEVLRLDVSACG